MSAANILLVTQIVQQLLQQASGLTQLIVNARTQNRDINSDELAELQRADDLAKKNLQALIDQRKSEEASLPGFRMETADSADENEGRTDTFDTSRKSSTDESGNRQGQS